MRIGGTKGLKAGGGIGKTGCGGGIGVEVRFCSHHTEMERQMGEGQK